MKGYSFAKGVLSSFVGLSLLVGSSGCSSLCGFGNKSDSFNLEGRKGIQDYSFVGVELSSSRVDDIEGVPYAVKVEASGVGANGFLERRTGVAGKEFGKWERVEGVDFRNGSFVFVEKFNGGKAEYRVVPTGFSD